ncbi:T9SS type A sorting domain-containing protein [Crocinitomix catalasitica]|uniref:T9SS type A sorting domain-containing protein n=1 Tax=Crocinitomix catalasitica TaxID=184607 RepID=UPI0009FF3B33|nr:T9SS type A sorting domain-containing protein [Crocinitomix catalasitica]
MILTQNISTTIFALMISAIVFGGGEKIESDFYPIYPERSMEYVKIGNDCLSKVNESRLNNILKAKHSNPIPESTASPDVKKIVISGMDKTDVNLLVVFDADGNQISVPKMESQNIGLDISDLKSGVYYIMINDHVVRFEKL